MSYDLKPTSGKRAKPRGRRVSHGLGASPFALYAARALAARTPARSAPVVIPLVARQTIVQRVAAGGSAIPAAPKPAAVATASRSFTPPVASVINVVPQPSVTSQAFTIAAAAINRPAAVTPPKASPLAAMMQRTLQPTLTAWTVENVDRVGAGLAPLPKPIIEGHMSKLSSLLKKGRKAVGLPPLTFKSAARIVLPVAAIAVPFIAPALLSIPGAGAAAGLAGRVRDLGAVKSAAELANKAGQVLKSANTAKNALAADARAAAAKAESLAAQAEAYAAAGDTANGAKYRAQAEQFAARARAAAAAANGLADTVDQVGAAVQGAVTGAQAGAAAGYATEVARQEAGAAGDKLNAFVAENKTALIVAAGAGAVWIATRGGGGGGRGGRMWT